MESGARPTVGWRQSTLITQTLYLRDLRPTCTTVLLAEAVWQANERASEEKLAAFDRRSGLCYSCGPPSSLCRPLRQRWTHFSDKVRSTCSKTVLLHEPRISTQRCPLLLGRGRQITIDSRYAAPATVGRYLHCSYASLLLSIDGTDRRTDTVPLHRRSPLEAACVDNSPTDRQTASLHKHEVCVSTSEVVKALLSRQRLAAETDEAGNDTDAEAATSRSWQGSWRLKPER